MIPSCSECECETVFFQGQQGTCGHCSHDVNRHARYCFVGVCSETAGLDGRCSDHADVVPFPLKEEDPIQALLDELEIICTLGERVKQPADKQLTMRLVADVRRRLKVLMAIMASLKADDRNRTARIKAMLDREEDYEARRKRLSVVGPNAEGE